MVNKTLQMGRIAIGLQGDGPVFEAIEAELVGNLTLSDARPSLEFRIGQSLPQISYRRNGSILIGDNGIRATVNGMNFDIFSLSNPTSIDISFDQRGGPLARISQNLSRLRNWNYLYRHEELAKNFLYDLFDWATQLIQLQQGQSYIHASSIERDGHGLAIMGWGGVGKTTSLLKLVLEDGWKFLSDDLGIVDTDGNLYRSPKRLQIYGYNCLGQPLIANRLLANRSIQDRLNWSARLALFGGKAIRRRIGAADLFGPKALCNTAPLKDIIYLEKTSANDYLTKEISASDVARRMSAIVMAEMEPYPRLVREAEAAGFADIPDIGSVQQLTRDVLEEAFAGKRCLLVQIGETPDPDRLACCVKELNA